MAVELATAYINIVSSSQGLGQSITNDLASAESDASSSGDRAGKGFVAAFGGVIAAGLAVGAVAKGLYEVGATFDDVSDTIRVGTGATGTALDGLVASAEKVGTQVPASFEQASSVVASLNQRLGLTGGTLETVASQYLAAGNILGEDIDINGTTAAFTAFGIKGEEVSGAMDKLFQVSQATGVGFNELASSVQSQAPALQTLGFSFDQTAGLIGNLDKAGLDSTAVVASLGKGLVKLAKDGEEPQAAFQRVTGEIGALIASGDKAGAIDLASGIFGTKGANQFIAAVESGTIAVGDLGTVAGITDDTILGAASETADFAESLTLFKNNALLALKPAGDAVFGALSSAMAGAVQYAAPLGAAIGHIGEVAVASFKFLAGGDLTVFDGLADDGNKVVDMIIAIRGAAEGVFKFLGGIGAAVGPGLKSAFDGILPAIGAVLTAVGPAFTAAFAGVGDVVGSAFGAIGSTLGSVFQQLAPVFAQLVPLVAQLLPLFNPIGLVLKALIPVLPVLADAFGQIAVAVGSALVSALSQLVPLLPVIADVLAQIAQVVAAGVMTAVTALIPVVTSLADAFLAILPTIISLVESVLPPLLGIFETLIPLIAQIVVQFAEFLVPAIEALVPVVQTVFEAIGPIIQAALAIVQGIITAVTGIISGDWSAVWDGIKAVFEGVWNGINAFISGAVDILKYVLSAAWEIIKPAVEAAWSAIKDFIVNPLTEAYNWVSGVFAGIAGVLGAIWQAAKAAASAVLDTLYDVFIAPFIRVKDWVTGVFAGIVDTFGKIWVDIKLGVMFALATLYDIFVAPFVKVYNWVRDTFAGIVGVVKGIYDQVKAVWDDIQALASKPVTINSSIVNKTLGIGTFPANADGGVYDPRPGGHLVQVAEAGEREIITPVGMMTRVVEDVMARTRIQFDGTSAAALSGKSGAEGLSIVLNHYGPGELAPEAVVRALREYERTSA